MKIFLNHKEIAQLSKSDMKSFMRGKPRDLITGRVLSAEEATANVMRMTHILFIVLGILSFGIIGGILVGLTFGGSDPDKPLEVSVCLITVPVLALIFNWGYRRAVRRWQTYLPERAAAMPAAGTPVRLDASGVSIGSISAPWSSLRIGQLDAVLVSSGEDSSTIVERLVLLGADEPMTLDNNFIENGPLMTVTACRRLLPKEV